MPLRHYPPMDKKIQSQVFFKIELFSNLNWLYIIITLNNSVLEFSFGIQLNAVDKSGIRKSGIVSQLSKCLNFIGMFIYSNRYHGLVSLVDRGCAKK